MTVRNKPSFQLTVFTVFLVLTGRTLAQQERPKITGISHMSVYTSDRVASEHFYMSTLGAVKAADPQDPNGTRFYLSPTQFIEDLPIPPNQGLSRMARVAFETADATGMHSYLSAHGAADATRVESAPDGSKWFRVRDPEGNEVEFFENGSLPTLGAAAAPIGNRIIHVGYLVKSRTAEDKFYRDQLGFKPYWSGAMQPNKVDWVSQQVPDGHDWLEYMLVGEGSTSPLTSLNASHMGVLNHFSIGVANMEAAVTTLYREDRLSPRHDGPQMGKDGKWQANLYDPDGTRVELMEFEPVMKPCCSPFLAASPRP